MIDEISRSQAELNFYNEYYKNANSSSTKDKRKIINEINNSTNIASVKVDTNLPNNKSKIVTPNKNNLNDVNISIDSSLVNVSKPKTKSINQETAQVTNQNSTPIVFQNNLVTPIATNEKIYIFTESQLKTFVSKIKNVEIPDLNFTNNTALQNKILIEEPNVEESENNSVTGNNVIDFVGNATLGTVNRVGHTITSLTENLLDIVCLGYGKKK